MADRDSNRDQRSARGGRGDSERELEEALERESKDLQGQVEENRNVSGSTTWQTLTDDDRQDRDRR